MSGAGLQPGHVTLLVAAHGASDESVTRTVDALADHEGVTTVVERAGGSRAAQLNAGLAQVRAQFTLLAEPGVVLDADVVDLMTSTLHRDLAVGAVGLDGEPAASARVRPVLHAAGGPLLVRTSALREVQGFSQDVPGDLVDVDLGWRLNVAGYDVVVQRDGRPRGQAAARPSFDREDLLRLLVRTLAPDTVARLASAVRDEALLATLRELPPPVEPAGPRRRTDLELLPLIASAGFDLPVDWDALRVRQKVLVLTPDTIGVRMAGPAIRAWELAHALADEHDVTLATLGESVLPSDRVTVVRVEPAGVRQLEAWCDIVVLQGFVMRDMPFLARTEKLLVADVYDPFHLEVLEQAKHLGSLTRRRASAQAADVLNQQLERADLLLCASAKQRDLYVGALGALGRINPMTYDGDQNLDQLLAVVPFGISAEPPRHRRPALKGVVPGIGPDDKVLLWGGGIYNWFDPLTLIRAVDRLRTERDDVRLFFLGLAHPNPTVPTMAMATAARQLADRLDLTGTHVFFNDEWVAYDERSSYLLEADLGVSCHYQHVETAFSFRTRILDYLWAGLPIVTTDGDVFADLVRERGLGAVVPPEDVEALAAAIAGLLGDVTAAQACRARVREVAAEYTWEQVTAPVRRFCRAPRPAADRPGGRLPDVTVGLDVPRPPRPSARKDLAVARQALEAGGLVELVRRAATRVHRLLHERRSRSG